MGPFATEDEAIEDACSPPPLPALLRALTDQKGAEVTTQSNRNLPPAECRPEAMEWFRGGVNKDLLREFVRLEKEGKLAT
jgi:hypothetical protein